MKKSLSLLLAFVLAFSLAACASSQPGSDGNQPVSSAASQTVQGELEQDQPETVIFTDSSGREVEIPANLERIAPSGVLAQAVLYTICPDQMIGLAREFSDSAKTYIDEKYWSLPVFGQFYGKNANLNMEALLAADPDIIIDIGEAKKTVKEDMDALQEQIGIPVVFIEATLPTMEQAYITLGELTGQQEQAAKLAQYCKEALAQAEAVKASIAPEDVATVYYALGDMGFNTNAVGSIHADVIEMAGGKNVVDAEVVSSSGGTEVSMEQILQWDPDVIITLPGNLYETIRENDIWQEVRAVKEGHVYEVPTGPYNFMSDPPSVNRLIGIKWLGNLLYPEHCPYDMTREIQEFYKLFYHIDVTEEQVAEILSRSHA